MKLVFECVTGVVPSNLRLLFTLNSEFHDYETGDMLVHVPGVSSSSYGINSIRYQGAVNWNKTFKRGIVVAKDMKMNISANQILNIHQLKRILKKHFFYVYQIEEFT